MPMLQSDDRLPMYLRLADSLRQQVIDGVLRPGNKVPSENELSRAYEIAPGTVRHALSQLVDEGLLQRLHGKGTFVRRPDFDRSLFRFFKFLGGIENSVVPDSKILSITRKRAPVIASDALQLDKTRNAIFIKRLRLIDAQPVLVEQIWLSEKRFKPLLNLNKEDFGPLLYPIYEKHCDAIVAKAEEVLTIDVADAETAERLNIPVGHPIVVIDRLAMGFDEKPLEWRRSFGRADQFHYRIEIR